MMKLELVMNRIFFSSADLQRNGSDVPMVPRSGMVWWDSEVLPGGCNHAVLHSGLQNEAFTDALHGLGVTPQTKFKYIV